MNRCAIAGMVAAAALACLPWTVRGNGMRLASQDGFATARGEAFVATADNASAIYYNPAGITQLEGHNVRAGLYAIYLDPTYQPPGTAANAGERYHIKKKAAGIPQLFYAFTPDDSALSFGIGTYAPFGLGVNWPQDTGFRSVALKGSMTYLTFNPVIAAELAPGFSLGAGLMVNYGDIQLSQGLLRTEMPFANYFRFEGDGWSAGFNLGLLWQLHEKLSVGATFRSGTTMPMSGRTEFEQQPIIQPGHRSARADFDFPATAAVGISFRPTPRWNLEFNADYTDWSSFGTIRLQQSSPPFPLQSEIPIKLRWESSWLYAFGVTRYFENGWHLSGGYVFNENSVPDTYYTPLAADLDRHFFSAGIGRKGKRFDIDVAYQFGYGPDRTVTGSSPSSTPGLFSGQRADGTYDFISHAVLMTAGMRF